MRACGIKFGDKSELFLLLRDSLQARERDAGELTRNNAYAELIPSILSVLHGLLKSIEVDANFSAAAVLIYCFVERKLVHFAVALNQCSRALISVLRRDMTKKLPRCVAFDKGIHRSTLADISIEGQFHARQWKEVEYLEMLTKSSSLF
jgi:hypothetical protein